MLSRMKEVVGETELVVPGQDTHGKGRRTGELFCYFECVIAAVVIADDKFGGQYGLPGKRFKLRA